MTFCAAPSSSTSPSHLPASRQRSMTTTAIIGVTVRAAKTLPAVGRDRILAIKSSAWCCCTSRLTPSLRFSILTSSAGPGLATGYRGRSSELPSS
jgi:hypothetical protein